MIWVGINDCSYLRSPSEQLRSLFQSIDQLYDAGARNFIFLSVPPFERSPWGNHSCPPVEANSAGVIREPERLHEYVADWNFNLPQVVDHWKRKHRDVRTAAYDTTYVFAEALDDPTRHGFRNATEVCGDGGCIWNDDLHPSFALHRLLAARLASWLDRL